jgi:heme A synthase
MKNGPLHFRAYAVTVAWTLVLLLLGSVVHATESSLACPDWPTCFGTMMPAMEGGVFWEHLHRLVAGGLMLMFLLATWLVRSEVPERTWLFRASLLGMGLLVVQAVFGGVTVLLRLPDWISTTHLGLALLFLGLATALAAASSPARARRPDLPPALRRDLVLWGGSATVLVLAQSLLGGAVRHMDAGMACPDVPTCLGSWAPPLGHPLVTVHFAHRVLGVLTMLVLLAATVKLLAAGAPHVRRAAQAMAALVVLQVALGFGSVMTTLAVVPVSLHTLVAASLLSVTVLLATWGALPLRPAARRAFPERPGAARPAPAD